MCSLCMCDFERQLLRQSQVAALILGCPDLKPLLISGTSFKDCTLRQRVDGEQACFGASRTSKVYAHRSLLL